MRPTPDQTPVEPVQFDFAAYPADTLFLDRRTLPPLPPSQGQPPAPPTNPGQPRRERRRRVDPTTFEKQYSPDELEFMNAVQNFKIHSGKMFPSHGDILKVALGLGYRKSVVIESDPDDAGDDSDERMLVLAGSDSI